MRLLKDSIDEVVDFPISLKCPHCNVISGLSVISPPNYALLQRFHPNKVGIGYRCNSCEEPVFLKFEIISYGTIHGIIVLSDKYQIVESPKEDFEFAYIPEPVRQDFKETLDCYSIRAYNGFAAMCRRTIQSSASIIGAKGKDKVLQQLTDLKEMAEIEEDDFEIIKQIILDGHDGAHPHLPSITVERANILLSLIKDVMYQLFVRRGKLAEASKLRKEQIEKK
jgi:hypothetical protein